MPWQIVYDIVCRWCISEILLFQYKFLWLESYFVPKLFWIRERRMYCGNRTQGKMNTNQFLATFLKNRKFLRGLSNKKQYSCFHRGYSHPEPPLPPAHPMWCFLSLWSHWRRSISRASWLCATFSLCHLLPLRALLLHHFLPALPQVGPQFSPFLLEALLGDLVYSCFFCLSAPRTSRPACLHSSLQATTPEVFCRHFSCFCYFPPVSLFLLWCLYLSWWSPIMVVS